MTIHVDVRLRYRNSSDAELQEIALAYKDLMPDAQQALQTEMNARGMQEGVRTIQVAEAELLAEASGPEYFVVGNADESMPGWFQLVAPIGDMVFPDFCPSCGKPADALYPVANAYLSKPMLSTVAKFEQLQYQVPHCRACRSLIMRGGLQNLLIILAAVASLSVVVGLWLGLRVGMAVPVICLFLLFNKIRALARRSHSGIVMLDYDDSSVSFALKDRNYAERFCEMNKGRS